MPVLESDGTYSLTQFDLAKKRVLLDLADEISRRFYHVQDNGQIERCKHFCKSCDQTAEIIEFITKKAKSN